jgi:Na+-translocating ferredoxin:NAD+ oxidoreductase RnfC subunit
MDLNQLVRNMGVIGAGGAGFPSHVKIENHCNTVIANGAECEPLLCNDKYTMTQEACKVIDGLESVMKFVNAKEGFIAVKKKYQTIISLLEKTISASAKENISIYPLDDYYPIGDEFLLVKEITNKVVPPGGIPLNIGCLVNNVETLKNISEAKDGNPVVEKALTCTGEVEKPAIVLAPIGMSIGEIIKLCKPKNEDFAVVIGGPMMGNVVYNLDEPITKTTSGLIVLARNHPIVIKKSMNLEHIIKQSKSACCQCTYCTELCPRYLLGHELYPHKIMRQINLGLDMPPEIIKNAFLCSECGLCEVFACPMGLSPRIINKEIKARLTASGYRPDFSNTDISTRENMFNRRIPTSSIKNRLRISEYDDYEKLIGNILRPETKIVEMLLNQHIGKVSEAIVKKGDQVNKGDLLADIPDDSLGARVHASISGEVVYLDELRIIIKVNEG